MSRRSTPLGPGGEFDLVRRMLAVWGDAAVGIGDDVATLKPPPGELVVTSTDMTVEGVHFRREWLTAREIAFRATTAAISDLAAAGARAHGLLVALSLSPSDTEQVEEFAAGIGEAARLVGATILGGDLTCAHQLSLAVTVFGFTPRPLGRDGARPGDRLYVTGALGGPGRAVAAWLRGAEPTPWARRRFAAPRARVAEALWLREQGVRAAIDISDGLSSELMHLAAASGVELRVDVRRIPAGDGGTWREACASGEEYELLIAAEREIDADAFARAFGIPLTMIGVVRASAAPLVIGRDGEQCVDLPLGHDHFSR